MFPAGTNVKAINEQEHIDNPDWYPEVGTIGVSVNLYGVTEYDSYGDIQWPKGSTSGNDRWCTDDEDLEPIQEEVTTQDET